VIDAVRDAVFDRVEGLGLSREMTVIPVAKGKTPKQERGSTANTQIMVSPTARPKGIRRFSNQHDLHTYTIEVTLWTPGNQDNTPHAEYSGWEDAIQQAFNRKPADLLNIDGLRDVRASTPHYVNRNAFKQMWDVIKIEVEVDIVRERNAP
jgi:hypothetical protein